MEAVGIIPVMTASGAGVNGRNGVVGVDAARVLGYTDPSEAMSRIVDSAYTCMGKLPMQGQTRAITIVFE